MNVTDHISPTKVLADDTFARHAASWDELLTNQVALYSAEELSYLARQPEWRRAQAVIDIGCGNGDFLRTLSTAFPEKTCAGIDCCAALVKIARERHRGSPLRFDVAKLSQSAVRERYDAAILRFVLQHVPDTSAFLRQARTLCRERSALIVIEPNVALSSMSPPLQILAARIADHERVSQRNLDSLLSQIPSCWHVRNTAVLRSTHLAQTWDRAAVRSVLHGWHSALAAADLRSAEVLAGRTAIDRWVAGERSELTLALNVLTLVAAEDLADYEYTRSEAELCSSPVSSEPSTKRCRTEIRSA